MPVSEKFFAPIHFTKYLILFQKFLFFIIRH